MRLNAAGLTDVGREREHNEDAIFYLVTRDASNQPLGLFVIADGVGGQLAGELASQWAVAAIHDALRDLLAPPGPDETHPMGTPYTQKIRWPRTKSGRLERGDSLQTRVSRAVQSGNLTVYAQAREHPEEAGNAGTTLTMALVQNGRAVIANVGDSRTYLLRGKRLQQITRDHSLIAGLVALGNVRPEDIFTHPARNVIVRSLGRDPDVEVDLFEEQLRVGDTLLLCSDGLWEMLHDDQVIGSIVAAAPTPLDACRQLIEAANTAGGSDNISVIVVRVE
ncbi:MAG TPA: protein phosphatase 2C domain-containing protein [Anaerolineae bacterium]|nr:protein phosphatase 2C domain-containing protein [Anaerolineae bacterium]